MKGQRHEGDGNMMIIKHCTFVLH